MRPWRRLSATLAMIGLSVLAACGVEYPTADTGSGQPGGGPLVAGGGMGPDTTPAPPRPY